VVKRCAAGSCQYDEPDDDGVLLRAVAKYLFSELGSPTSSVIHSPTIDKFVNGFTPILRIRKRYLLVLVSV